MDRLPEFVETPRLILRHWTEDDAVALAEAIEDSLDHLRPWMPWASDKPSTPVDRIALIRQWRADWEKGGDSFLGIFRQGEVVGGTGLHRSDSPDTVEIGYWIHVDHLRRGYATEATRALTEAAFEMPGIDCVQIRHDKANAASEGIPRSLGFTRLGERTVKKVAPAWSGRLVVWVKHRPDRQ